MSSSFSGGGFGGSQGTVKYAIIIDDTQVNSKLANFQTQLGRLDSATRSSGTGLTTLNNNFQTMETNVQNAGRDLDAINNNFKTMDSSVQSTTKNMGALNNNFQSAQGGLTKFNTLQGQVTDTNRTLGNRLKTAGGIIRDNALAFGVVSSSIIDLVGNYTDLQRSRVAADRAQVMAERTQQRVVKLQAELNKMLAAGKQNTQEYAIKQKDLEIAQDAAGVSAERASLATQSYKENLGQFGQRTIQDAVLTVSGVVQMFSGIKDVAPLVHRGLSGIAGGIRGLGAAALAATPYIVPLLIALAAAPNLIKQGQNLIKSFDPNQSEIDRLKAMKENIQELMKPPEFTDPNTWSHILMPKETLEMHKKEIEAIDKRIKELESSTTDLGDTTDKAASSLATFRNQTDLVDRGIELGIRRSMGEWDVVMNDTIVLTKGLAGTISKDMQGALTKLDETLGKTTSGVIGSVVNETLKLDTGMSGAAIEIGRVTNEFIDLTKTKTPEWLQLVNEEARKAAIELAQFQQKSHLDLFATFDIKTPEERMQKGLDKFEKIFEKQLNKMHIKFDVDKVLDIESKTEGFKMLAAKLIGGMAPYIRDNDQLADAFAMSLIKLAPKGKEGDKIRAWLEEQIAKTDTGKSLQDSIDTKNSTITIPVTADVTKIEDSTGMMIDIDPNSVGSGVMNKLDTRGARFKSGTKTVGTVPLTGVITNIAYSDKGDTPPGTELFAISKAATEVNKAVQKEFSSMFGALQGIFSGIAGEWSKDMNSMGNNAASANKQVIKEFDKMISKADSGFLALAKQWSKDMNSMIANAKSAAKGVNKALDGIKDQEVTIHVGLSGPGASRLNKGGIIKSLAQGGIVSAATGITTNGPQLLLVGDNPGGKETIAAVPHNDPWPTIGLLAKQFGRNDVGSGSVNQTINVHISGNDIINERNLTRKIRMEMGKNRDRFG